MADYLRFDDAVGAVDMNGWLDEVRITKGVARYQLQRADRCFPTILT